MDFLTRFWTQYVIAGAAMLIATLEFFGFDTRPFWDLLWQARAGLGL